MSDRSVSPVGKMAVAWMPRLRAAKEGNWVKRSILALMCVVGLLLLCVSAWAGMTGPLTVRATSGGKVATWTYNWTTGCNYQLGAPVDLRASDNTLLGRLTGLNCSQGADPFVTLDFGVHAFGDTTFTFDSGVLSFAPIDPAMAFATAATTLTADGNGATFTGNFAGGKAYEATYNGGTLFADLDGSFTSPANTSTTQTDRSPASGFGPIVGPVSSIRAQWNFTLSGGDDASGTSRFDVEPVPDASTLGLAFAGAAPLLMAFRRRRRA